MRNFDLRIFIKYQNFGSTGQSRQKRETQHSKNTKNDIILMIKPKISEIHKKNPREIEKS